MPYSVFEVEHVWQLYLRSVGYLTKNIKNLPNSLPQFYIPAHILQNWKCLYKSLEILIYKVYES